jgi:hypothetical protein
VAQPVTANAANATGSVTLTPEMLTRMVTEITAGVIANVRSEGEKAGLTASLLAAAPDEHRQSLGVTYDSMSVEQLRALAAALPPAFPTLTGTMPPMAANFGPLGGGAPPVNNAALDQADTLPDPDYSFLNVPRRRRAGRVGNGQAEPAAAE